MTVRSASLSVLAAVCLCAATVAAQETTGTIAGRIVDSQGLPMPAVTVTVTGVQGSRSVPSDAHGQFTVPFLPPGTYALRAELQGFKTVQRANLIVALGKTTDVPLTLEVGPVTETVQVVAAPPVVDLTSTTTGANISSDTMQQVPIGRTISSALYMAPGVSSSNTAGAANPSIGGGSALDNQYVVDGVNVTNTGYGALGSYSIVFGSLGNATPFDFIQEVQVKTGGYEAEYGQATGGVVNVVTKSGGNTLRGSVFGYGAPSGLEAGWKQYQTVNGSVQTEAATHTDAGAEGGFPLMRNRLFFFGAVDPGRDVRSLQAPDGFPLRSLGTVDQIRRTNTYSAKLTWQINAAQRVDASFFGDPSTGANGPQRLRALLGVDTAGFSSLHYGGHNQTIAYSGALGQRWLLEGGWARALNRIDETPSVDTWRITDQTVSPTVHSGGIGFYEAGNRSVNNQFFGKATVFAGTHAIKAGLEYDAVDYSQINQRTGPTFLAADGRTTATGAEITILPDVNFGQIYSVTRANFNTGRDTTQKYVDFFVQDQWRVGDRLIVNPGIRYEQETLNGTLVTGFSLKNNWAPRIGAAYDVLGDGRTKIYGNYGRYYARVPNDLAARSLSADDSISRADYFDAQLTQPIPNGVVTEVPGGGAITNHFVLAGVGADTIDPNAKLGYTNEIVAGAERQILPQTSLDVRYIHRSIGRVLEDVANAPMTAYELGLPGLDSVEYILTNPSSSTPVLPSAAFLGATFDSPTHTYNAVEITLDRRLLNRWSALASYRWSRLRGNFEGFYRDDNGQSDPGITSLYDFPTNDPSYTSIGVPQYGFSGDIRYLGESGILPLDRPHQVKVFGTYEPITNLNVGVGVNLSSGAPLTAMAANPIYSNGGEIPVTARGAGIQTVDGFKTRSPFTTEVDLQGSYAIPLGPRGHDLTLVGDVFNLFNSQQALTYDQWTELTFGVPNPDFGKPVTQVLLGAPPQFQAPLEVRVGARFSF
jgi:outer membrane receptor protein involved in Fe transport